MTPGVRELDDGATVRDAARRQNVDAVIALIEQCEKRIVAGIEIAGVSRSSSGFDDAQNLALLEIWKSFPSYRASSPVCAWMHGVARRVAASRVVDSAVRHRRRIGRIRQATRPVDLTDADPSSAIADRDLLSAVLASLSEQHREVLVMRYLEGFSERETALLLGVSEKTVSSRTSRAKRAALVAVRGMEDER